MTHIYTSYAAVGDSFTEGVGDELPDGRVRGWADLVALGLALAAADRAEPTQVTYANLAIRGRLLAPIVAGQMDAAIALTPQLLSINGGGNDIMRPRVSIDSITDFTDELDTFLEEEGAPALENYSYAAESFDATVLLALASLAAGGATDGAGIAEKLMEVSGGSGDGEKCTSFAECAKIINDGGTADYDGYSGDVTFDENGDPQGATIGIYKYVAGNTIERTN